MIPSARHCYIDLPYMSCLIQLLHEHARSEHQYRGLY